VGFGAYSLERLVTADSLPTFMNVGQVAVNEITPKSMKVTWNGIETFEHTGGDPVVYYELQWFDYTIEDWIILTTPSEIIQYEFLISRTEIFPSGSEQYFRLRAENGVGFGAFSTEFTIVADSVPTFAYMPTNTSVSPTTMTFVWQEITSLTHTGGDPVVYYEMEYDSGDGEWEIITSEVTQGASLSLSFTPAEKFPDN
jgi:hypothetical protein